MSRPASVHLCDPLPPALLPCRAEELRAAAATVEAEHSALEARLRGGGALPANEEAALRRVDDELDALEAEEEYLEQELGALRAQAAAADFPPPQVQQERNPNGYRPHSTPV